MWFMKTDFPEPGLPEISQKKVVWLDEKNWNACSLPSSERM